MVEMPHNMEAEQALLGAIMSNNEAMNHIVPMLEPRHFYAELHQRIFEAVLSLRDESKVATPVNLKTILNADGKYLASLVGAACYSSQVYDYSVMIHDLAVRRMLIDIAGETIQQAVQMDGKAIDKLEQAEQKLFNVAAGFASEGDFIPVTNAVDGALINAERAHKNNGKLSGITTGFIDLDEVINGLNAPDLLIIAGRPAMGKTALAVNVSEKAAESLTGGCGGIFSLEMSKEQLAMRMLAGRSSISSNRIQGGNLSDDEFQKLLEYSKMIKKLPLHIEDTPALSISQIRAKARRLKRKKNMKFLVIDYLQLIRPSKSRGNRVEELSEITQGLKAIAKELHIPVIALSQLSRAVEMREDKRPQLADLRESGSIEQDADIVMFVYREEYYLKRAEPKEGTQQYNDWQIEMANCAGKAELIIAKHRNGACKNIDLIFKGETTQFFNTQ